MLTLSTKNWYVSTVSTFSTYKFFVGCGCTKTLFKKLIWSLRENTSIFFYYQKLEKNLKTRFPKLKGCPLKLPVLR